MNGTKQRHAPHQDSGPGPEDRYRSLFQNMLEGLAYCQMEVDPDGRPCDFVYLDVNDAFAALTGLKDVIGRRVTELIPGIRDSNPELFEIFGRVARSGQSEKFETYVPELDNWFSISVYSPQSGFFVAVFENLTERRRTAQTLENNERRFRALIENSLEQVSLLAADGTLIWESSSALHTLGYEQDQHLGQSIFPLVHPDDLEDMKAEFAALLREPGGRRTHSHRIRHADGSWRWVEGVVSNLLDDPAVGAIVINYRDVTERKLADEALSKSEERYRLLFENNPHPLWVYDVQTLAFLAVNDAAVDAYGYSREEFLRLTVRDLHPEEELPRVNEILARPLAPHRESGGRHRLRDGRLIDVTISSHPMELDGRACALVLAEDVTEKKRAEERARYMTRLYATISQVNEAIVRVTDPQELFQQVCDVAVECGEFRLAWVGSLDVQTGKVVPQAYAGYEAGYLQLLDVNTQDEQGSKGPTSKAIRSGQAVSLDDITADPNFMLRQEALERGYRSYAAVPIRKNNAVIGNLSLYAPEIGFFSEEEMRLLEEIGEDISFALDTIELESKRTRLEDERRQAEERFRRFFELGVVGMTITSPAKGFVEVNDRLCEMLGYTRAELMSLSWEQLTHPADRAMDNEHFSRLLSGELDGYSLEKGFIHKSGRLVHTALSVNAIRTASGALDYCAALLEDITERKQAEAQQKASEEKYHSLFNHVPDGVYRTSREGELLAANPALVQMLGFSSLEELQRIRVPEIFADPLERPGMLDLIRGKQEARNLEVRLTRKDGAQIIVLSNALAVRDDHGKVLYFEGTLTDITARKQAEEALRLENQRFQRFVESNIVGITIAGPGGQVSVANDYYLNVLGASRQDLLDGKVRWTDFTPPEWLPADAKAIEQLRASGTCEPYEKEYQRADGTRVSVFLANAMLPGPEEQIATFVLDIGERKQAEKRVRQQLNRITGLRDVDRAITSSFDLQLSMNTILTQVREQLGVEASSISILDPISNTLNCVAARGLRDGQVGRSIVRLGKGLAGTAALERHAVHYSDLRSVLGNSPEEKALLADGLTDYYGVPLISKGQVKGILEVFHRSHRDDDQDWLEYLETLAGQAAIAIDNIQMLEGLNRFNLELTQAYDATIEGWSRALDLRDKETKGHTQRVVELTLQLARAFRVDEKLLTNMRWGALLHDIGKLGVPDAILLKPGELTLDERLLMMRHPEFGYDMLRPIHYLRGALDIPLCHHEKWDGTGYPKGLRAEQIPLAARIFAIVDIWDALRSDRPYRSAWPEEKTLDYIRGLSGTHLDPQVVQAFFDNKIYKLERTEG